MPKIIPASATPSETGHGSARARLLDETLGLATMTLERITLEPGVDGPEVVGDGCERFIYVIRGEGWAGDLLLAPETMVWIEPGDRLRLRAGDDELELLLAAANASDA